MIGWKQNKKEKGRWNVIKIEQKKISGDPSLSLVWERGCQRSSVRVYPLGLLWSISTACKSSCVWLSLMFHRYVPAWADIGPTVKHRLIRITVNSRIVAFSSRMRQLSYYWSGVPIACCGGRCPEKTCGGSCGGVLFPGLEGLGQCHYVLACLRWQRSCGIPWKHAWQRSLGPKHRIRMRDLSDIHGHWQGPGKCSRCGLGNTRTWGLSILDAGRGSRGTAYRSRPLWCWCWWRSLDVQKRKIWKQMWWRLSKQKGGNRSL